MSASTASGSTAHPVTNEEFARFVKDTGYVTFAERAADPLKYPGAKPELLVPSSVVFRKPIHQVDLRNHYNWWFYVPGRELASSARAILVDREEGDASRGPRRATRTRKPMRAGPARSCRPKRNGNSPRAAD